LADWKKWNIGLLGDNGLVKGCPDLSARALLIYFNHGRWPGFRSAQLATWLWQLADGVIMKTFILT